MPTIENLFPLPPDRQDTVRRINDALDILSELRDNQFLLECLDQVIGGVYSEHHQNRAVREGLTNISTVLRAYDNDHVTERLKTAIALLSESV